ncbi:ABC transporter substrate-binding protein [Dickeya solani]|uniref:ABC transporter substrate-binding protein n=1 Tax=Dickeya solani TaxID=1089444 RepID=A0ABU4ED62_9GAMM|nr:ABC transporter substrate-binding protein [Dickeya solani]MCA6998080.1 ABC transporter substrate-binding protein [Dickeya solani]MCZ0784280.1 ABC transporter substrate-binding protein [Dickeya solani]MCZ0792103.1 ABC transporter substrate-binding protein [Dickeya solani]MCZ0800780.1 ABC transporter substrate-binding protein [Dickeya solani]MCZ0802268.1 ABC transporter substrate-binding protein [Dickeya solani]
MKIDKRNVAAAGVLLALSLVSELAQAAGILTIGRREDSTTFDPIKSAQNADNWVFSNVFDVLIRVDKTGTKLEPGLAQSWTVSPDGKVYTFTLREARFSDGSPVTAQDAVFSLTRIRDSKESLWRDSYSIIDKLETRDAHTLVVTLKSPSAPFLSQLALPNASVLPEKVVSSLGEETFAEKPIGSGAFVITSWARGDKIVLAKNPYYWQADHVSLDGVEWQTIPDDNTRMLKVQAGELDAALSVPFSRLVSLQKDPNLKVALDPSTREDSLLINHSHGLLGKVEVRQALDYAIDKSAIVKTVTFNYGTVANSYIPKGALYYYADNLQRPYDPEKAKQMLKAAGASDLKLNYVVNAGDEVDEQIAVLLQQQLAKAGITVNLQKVDPSQSWSMLVAGDFDVSVNYWTNDILDPDQKTTFVLGHDSNMNYMTRYQNDKVKALVAAARVELDPKKREQMYIDLQKMAKDDANWIDLYYSPYRNVTRKNISGFYQNPLGRFFLEDTVKG